VKEEKNGDKKRIKEKYETKNKEKEKKKKYNVIVKKDERAKQRSTSYNLPCPRHVTCRVNSVITPLIHNFGTNGSKLSASPPGPIYPLKENLLPIY
jgi:hypothetical protein